MSDIIQYTAEVRQSDCGVPLDLETMLDFPTAFSVRVEAEHVDGHIRAFESLLMAQTFSQQTIAAGFQRWLEHGGYHNDC